MHISLTHYSPSKVPKPFPSNPDPADKLLKMGDNDPSDDESPDARITVDKDTQGRILASLRALRPQVDRIDQNTNAIYQGLEDWARRHSSFRRRVRQIRQDFSDFRHENNDALQEIRDMLRNNAPGAPTGRSGGGVVGHHRPCISMTFNGYDIADVPRPDRSNSPSPEDNTRTWIDEHGVIHRATTRTKVRDGSSDESADGEVESLSGIGGRQRHGGNRPGLPGPFDTDITSSEDDVEQDGEQESDEGAQSNAQDLQKKTIGDLDRRPEGNEAAMIPTVRRYSQRNTAARAASAALQARRANSAAPSQKSRKNSAGQKVSGKAGNAKSSKPPAGNKEAHNETPIRNSKENSKSKRWGRDAAPGKPGKQTKEEHDFESDSSDDPHQGASKKPRREGRRSAPKPPPRNDDREARIQAQVLLARAAAVDANQARMFVQDYPRDPVAAAEAWLTERGWSWEEYAEWWDDQGIDEPTVEDETDGERENEGDEQGDEADDEIQNDEDVAAKEAKKEKGKGKKKRQSEFPLTGPRRPLGFYSPRFKDRPADDIVGNERGMSH